MPAINDVTGRPQTPIGEATISIPGDSPVTVPLAVDSAYQSSTPTFDQALKFAQGMQTQQVSHGVIQGVDGAYSVQALTASSLGQAISLDAQELFDPSDPSHALGPVQVAVRATDPSLQAVVTPSGWFDTRGTGTAVQARPNPPRG